MESIKAVTIVEAEHSKSSKTFVRIVTTLFFAGLLTGCAAGPDFIRPAVPEVTSYTAALLPAQTASTPIALGEAQRFSIGTSVGAQWWRELGSPRLNVLINEALQASPTLAAAQATLRQAQEIHAAQAGSMLYPQVDAGIDVQRQRANPSALGQVGDAREFSLYNTGIGVHYQFDLAGGNRRALEALAARAEYQRYELEAARLSLAGSIATTAIAQAKLSGHIQVMEIILQIQDGQLDIGKERVRLGQAVPDEVLTLQTQVEQTRAELPLLRKELEQNQHFLVVLIGQSPGAASLHTFTLEDFTLPSDLPLIVPSELVRHRPDILAAESLLHAANAEYGVAVANLYPQLNISASLGSQALSTDALFGSGSAIWSLVGQLTQPLFKPGLPAEKRAALAAFEAASANYQGVVLEALRNVADVLRAIKYDAESLTARAVADNAAQRTMESMKRQYALGAASYIQVLIAQQQAQNTRIDLVGAQAARLSDTVALYQAMGGGISREVLAGEVVLLDAESN